MLLKFGEYEPAIENPVFIGPGSYLIGQVRVEKEASIWFNAVVRADTTPISIGRRTNVQDGAVIHADPGYPCQIGHDVTIGHRAVIHGATLEDYVLVGMGAVIMNGALIGHHCIIGAGAVVPEGMVIPPSSLVLGMPARVVRSLNEENVKHIEQAAQHYVDLWVDQNWSFH